MPIDELAKRVAQAIDLIKQIRTLLPGGYLYTAQERGNTNGHVREGEENIWLQIVDIAIGYPQFFEDLKDADQGVDPTRLETDLMKDRVRRAQLLGSVASALMDLTQPNVSDTALHLRSLVRGPVREIYAIAKTVGKHNQGIKNLLAPILDYYRELAKAAQEGKAKKNLENQAVAEAEARRIAAEEAAAAKEAADAAAARAAEEAAAIKAKHRKS
jgi:hypothetical protein